MFAPRWVFALPLALLLILAAIMRSRSVGVVLVCGLVVGWPVMGFNVPWPQLTRGNPTGTPLRVVTLNMHFSNAAPKPLEDLVAAEAPDIVAIQEWGGHKRSTLRSDRGWHVHRTPPLFLASRYPIRKIIELGKDSSGEHASVSHYELDTPDGSVHLFNLHTASVRDGVYDMIHEKSLAEVRANSALRRQQSAFVAAKAAQCQGPVLIVGDFNTTSESYIFTDVWSGYTDAFGAAGWGWGYTFFGAKTAVRIDHILAGKGWVCTACRVGASVGSPHRPVIADLVWIGDKQNNGNE
jgi:endonuclease/exonuclease/phosphatase (EEP) superfamily protein YafD